MAKVESFDSRDTGERSELAASCYSQKKSVMMHTRFSRLWGRTCTSRNNQQVRCHVKIKSIL